MNLNERSYLALSENVMDYWVLSYHYQMSTLENTGFRYFLLPQQVFLYFHLYYLTNGNSKAVNTKNEPF